MAEIFESLCLICNPKCWESICNSDCIGKCVECPGQCFNGVCDCAGNCCKDISCDWFYTLCSSCCSCSSSPCAKIFEHSCCLNMEQSCLSLFNCSNYLSNFSRSFESLCNFYTNRIICAAKCWFFCMPNNCLLTIGYSPGYYNHYRSTHQAPNSNKSRVNNIKEENKSKKEENPKEVNKLTEEKKSIEELGISVIS